MEFLITMSRNILLTILIISLAGCVHQSTSDTSTNELIAESSYINPIPNVISQNEIAHIIIVRDGGFAGSALKADLYLNGSKVVNLKPEQYVKLKVNPGNHQLSLNSNGFALLPVSTKAEAYLTAGNIKHYRVKVVWGAGMQISEMTEK